MKLADIEDANTLATKQDLEIMSHKLSDQFHKELLGVVQWMGLFFMGFATIILGGVYFMLSTMVSHWKP
jgi:hypothetical protein